MNAESLDNIKALDNLCLEIEDSLHKKDAETFSRLINQRNGLIQSLQQENQTTTLPPDLLRRLTIQNQRWIESAQAILTDTHRKIEKVKALNKTSHTLANAYSLQSGRAKFISRNG